MEIWEYMNATSKKKKKKNHTMDIIRAWIWQGKKKLSKQVRWHMKRGDVLQYVKPQVGTSAFGEPHTPTGN